MKAKKKWRHSITLIKLNFTSGQFCTATGSRAVGRICPNVFNTRAQAVKLGKFFYHFLGTTFHSMSMFINLTLP